MGIPNPAVVDNARDAAKRKKLKEEKLEKLEEKLEEGLAETFPASDPPSVTQPVRCKQTP